MSNCRTTQKIVDLIKESDPKGDASTPKSTPKVQNTFVIHGGSQVFLQTGMAFHISSNVPVSDKSGS